MNEASYNLLHRPPLQAFAYQKNRRDIIFKDNEQIAKGTKIAIEVLHSGSENCFSVKIKLKQDGMSKSKVVELNPRESKQLTFTLKESCTLNDFKIIVRAELPYQSISQDSKKRKLIEIAEVLGLPHSNMTDETSTANSELKEQQEQVSARSTEGDEPKQKKCCISLTGNSSDILQEDNSADDPQIGDDKPQHFHLSIKTFDQGKAQDVKWGDSFKSGSQIINLAKNPGNVDVEVTCRTSHVDGDAIAIQGNEVAVLTPETSAQFTSFTVPNTGPILITYYAGEAPLVKGTPIYCHRQYMRVLETHRFHTQLGAGAETTQRPLRSEEEGEEEEEITSSEKDNSSLSKTYDAEKKA